MSHASCSLLPSFFSQKIILPPIEEAQNQFSFAFFQLQPNAENEPVEGPSLIGRVTHLTKGLLLTLPLVNWVVLTVMNFFSMTLTGHFQYMIDNGDLEGAEVFLNLGLDPNMVDEEEVPLIIRAAEKKNIVAVRLLLEHGADPNTIYDDTPLIHYLLQKGDYDFSREVISVYRADPSALDSQGKTLLEVLYDKNRDQFLHFISEGVVHPNLMDEKGDTIVHYILDKHQTGDEEAATSLTGVIIELVEKGVDLNIRSGSTQKTPLWLAYQKLGPNGAVRLMNAGAILQEKEDLKEQYPGESNLLLQVWRSLHQSGVGVDLDQLLFLMQLALKCGAPVIDELKRVEGQICEMARDLDPSAIKELYPGIEGDSIEKKRVELLATMEKKGWGIFAKAYRNRHRWRGSHRTLWLSLLREGAKPPSQSDPELNADAIMGEVLDHLDIDDTLLKEMQRSGWEVARIAHQKQKYESLVMLLRNGGPPPTNVVSQGAIIKWVATSGHKEDLIPIMLENSWDFEPYFNQAIEQKDYNGVRFAIEMGMTVTQFGWQTARQGGEYCSYVLRTPEGIVPSPDNIRRHLGLGYTEEAFLTKLFENIKEYNEKSSHQKINSLEVVLFMHSKKGVLQLMKTSGFETFSSMLVEVIRKYPHMSLDWVWEDLMQIPSSHYSNYASVQGGADALPELPYQVPIDILYSLFDRINFDDPSQPDYKDEEARKENGRIQSKSQIRKGIENIVRKISHHLPDAVAPNDLEQRKKYYEDHKKHLEVVAYYLQLKWDDEGKPIPDPNNPGEFLRENLHSNEPLHAVKANVLIDLGRTGQMCSGRWKEIFYQCRCRVSDEEEKALSFVDQMRTLWGRERAFILEGLHRRGTHTRDNLMYHLKEVRGIPGDKPMRLDPYGQYFPNFGQSEAHERQRAIRDFDARGYAPNVIWELFIDYMDQDNDDGNDFRELMLDWMSDNLAQAFKGAGLEAMRIAAKQEGLLGKHLTYDQLESFIHGFDPAYVLQRPSFTTYAQFMRAVEKSSLVSLLELPEEGAVMASLETPRRQAEEKSDRFIGLSLSESKRASYNACISRKHELESRMMQLEEQLLRNLNESQLNRYEQLKESDDLSENEKQELEKLLQDCATDEYRNVKESLEEVVEQYRSYIQEGRLALQKMSSQRAVLQHFWLDGDLDQYDTLLANAQAKRAAFSAMDDAIDEKVLLQGQEAYARYGQLCEARDGYYLQREEEEELNKIIREFGGENHEQLREEADSAEEEFRTFLMPFCEKFGLRQAPRNGLHFMQQHYFPLVQQSKMVAFKMDHFIEQAGQIKIKQEQTLNQFMSSELFQSLQAMLGAEMPRVDTQKLGSEKLSTPELKEWLAKLLVQVATSTAPHPMNYYVSQYHKERFSSVMRPLKEGGENVFQKTYGFNPLVLFQMLVELGELEYKDRAIFPNAFTPLP